MPYLRSNHFKGTWSEGGAEEVSIMTMGLTGGGRKELNGHIDPQILTEIVDSGTKNSADIMSMCMCKRQQEQQEQHTEQNIQAGKAQQSQGPDHTAMQTQDDDVYASKPPTPPQSRPGSPRLTIAPCPARLEAYTVPRNYGTVEKDTIYRSGKPAKEDLKFLSKMKINTMLTLIDPAADDKRIDLEVYDFIRDANIKHENVIITPNKDKVGTRISTDSLCQALLIAMNPLNHPVYIHCNQGRHRTGCIVACLRIIQQWPVEDAVTEYETYAHPKPRKEDIAFIRSFDPSIVFEYSQQGNRLSGWPRQERADSATSIYELASCSRLPFHESVQCFSRSSSSGSDDDLLMMARPRSQAWVTRLARPVNEDDKMDVS